MFCRNEQIGGVIFIPMKNTMLQIKYNKKHASLQTPPCSMSLVLCRLDARTLMWFGRTSVIVLAGGRVSECCQV